MLDSPESDSSSDATLDSLSSGSDGSGATETKSIPPMTLLDFYDDFGGGEGFDEPKGGEPSDEDCTYDDDSEAEYRGDKDWDDLNEFDEYDWINDEPVYKRFLHNQEAYKLALENLGQAHLSEAMLHSSSPNPDEPDDSHSESPPPRRPLGNLSNRVESSQRRKDKKTSAKEARRPEKEERRRKRREQEEDEARERELKDSVERPPGRFSLSRFLLGDKVVEGYSPPPDVAVLSYEELLTFQVSAFPVIKSNLGSRQRTGGGTSRSERNPWTAWAGERNVVLDLDQIKA
ncbi:uncharacterized protein JCM15063_001739 [Sporobolomyces koalae]|uniref:uncharacterized protein n=1 Tax=Sporobolomyces koalae TaxID=500713 RepID=UPI003170DDC5